MIEKKPYAIIQIDCDREWDDINISIKILSEFRKILEENKLRATWFVVGNDLEFPAIREMYSSIMESGHEIGNHTYTHRKDFILLKEEDKKEEIEKCDSAIRNIGYKAMGFRTPYFGVDYSILNILKEMRYQYDSSICPSPFLYIISRIKEILNYGFTKGQSGNNVCKKRAIIKRVYGEGITEIPISVFPYLKFPIHASYAMVLPLKISYIATHLLFKYLKNKDMPLIYVFHLNDLCPDRYLKSKEFKYLMPLEKRKDFINRICSKISCSFQNKLTWEYADEKSKNLY